MDSAIHLLNNYVINSLRAGYDTYNFVAIKMGSTVNSGALRTVQEHASGGGGGRRKLDLIVGSLGGKTC